MDIVEKTKQASSPYPGGSPRLVLRFSDIRSGLKQTSLSASFSEPNSPSGMCLNNITKTLCTPSPQTRRFKRYDITPKSETKRRVDLGTPQFKSSSLTDTPHLPVFTNLNISSSGRGGEGSSSSCKKPRIGRCLALSFQDDAKVNDSSSSSSSSSSDEASSEKDSTDTAHEIRLLHAEPEGEFKRPAPPMSDGIPSTPKKIPRPALVRQPRCDESESAVSVVETETEFDPDCFICAQIGCPAPKDSTDMWRYSDHAASRFFNPIKQEKLTSPKVPQFTQIQRRPRPNLPLPSPPSEAFYPCYMPEERGGSTGLSRSSAFSLDRLPCLFCVKEIAPLSPQCPPDSMRSVMNFSPTPLRNESCSCPNFCN